MDEEYEGWTFAQLAAFNCCIDYLVMLIEKYGKEKGEKIIFRNCLRVLKENSENL